MAKNEKKEKNGGKGAGVGAAIAALILLLGGGAWGIGLGPGGNGLGNGPINELINPNTTSAPENNNDNNNNDDKKEQTVIIKIEQSEISVDGIVCENAYDMISKVKAIMADNSKTTFELQTITPVKSTYEQVTDALKNIEGIKISGLE